MDCSVTALRKGGTHALTGSASGTNSVILKNLYFLPPNDPCFHAVLWGRGHPDPRTLKLFECPFFGTVLWGRAPPRPEAKTPRPSTLARISHAIQSEAECSPGGAATRRLEIAAACTPAPSARAPTTNPPHSTACADTQDQLKLFAGVWRG